MLSAALSWAATSDLVPEIEVNGCRLATEPRGNKRRSLIAGGAGYAPRGRRTPGWALSPQAVEAIRAEILKPGIRREEILAHRDAMVVSLQYGLCARNQEVWGLRWSSLIDEFAWVLEVLSCGRLGDWGKTEHSTQRRTAIPAILREDLAAWRMALRRAGRAARELDFIIPGDLAGARHGAREARTGTCHFSENQARAWGARFFTPAVNKVAERTEFLEVLGATRTRCAAAGSPCACAPRTRRPSPASAAPACGCSQTTTRSRSRISAATGHDRRSSSGVWRARSSWTDTSRSPRAATIKAQSRQDPRVVHRPSSTRARVLARARGLTGPP